MKVDAAETFLRDNGIRFFRVRHHDDKTARIELGAQDFHRIFDDELRARLVVHLKNLGYQYITLDLQGYRTGSMNEVLTPQEKEEAFRAK
jgi:uncharacterized protein